MQSRRDKAAARRFFRRLLKKTRVFVTDKLRSYRAAHREVMPSVEHRSHKGLNNRAENSHQPTRQRERAMKGFRSVGGAQRFLSAFSGISPPLPTPPPPDDSPRTPPRDDPPLHPLGPHHRRHRPTHHSLTTDRLLSPVTPQHTVRYPHTQQRDNALYRDHAEVEDRVKAIKQIGLGLLPSKSWQLHVTWVLAATIAADLDAWMRLLLLHDEPDLAATEPETIRMKLYHLPARLTSHARRCTLHLDRTWPWATAFTTAWQRADQLPART